MATISDKINIIIANENMKSDKSCRLTRLYNSVTFLGPSSDSFVILLVNTSKNKVNGNIKANADTIIKNTLFLKVSLILEIPFFFFLFFLFN